MQAVSNIAKDIKDHFFELNLASWSSIAINVDFSDGLESKADIDIAINYSSPSNVEFLEPDANISQLFHSLGRLIANEQSEQGVLTEFEFVIKNDGDVSLKISFDRHADC